MKLKIVVGSIFTILLIHNVQGKLNFEGLKKMTKPLRGTCTQQSGVSPDVIDDSHHGNFADDPQLKCYFMCIFQKLKAIKGGKLSPSAMKTQIQALVEDSLAVRLIQVVDACEHETNIEDICEAAFAYCKCATQYDNSLNFFP